MAKIKYKVNKKKRYVTGGMYASNTLPQGIAPGSTANTVFNETDPEKQSQRVDSMNSEVAAKRDEAAAMASQIQSEKASNTAAIEASAAAAKQKSAAIETGLSKGVSTISDMAAKFAKPGDLNFAQRTAQKGQMALKAGNANKAARLGRRSAKLAQWGDKAGQAAKFGQATTKAGAMLRNPNAVGTVASLAGQGIGMLSDDKDATTMNFGESAGATIGGIGQGIGAASSAAALMGTSLGPVGTAIGAVGGALYGVGKGLVQRKKARKEKARQDAELKGKVEAHNEKLNKSIIGQKAQVRAGELEQKTYSGYDLGRNISAKYGGVKKYI